MTILATMYVFGIAIYYVEFDSTRNTDFHYDEIKCRPLVGRVAMSILYSVALFSAVGGHTPKTAGGKILHITLGFSFMVVIAACK